jgi:hypothetical protein
MDFVHKPPVTFFAKPSNAIDTLILRLLDQLHPEITAKQLRIELDLDHVCLQQLSGDIRAAVQGMFVNFIACALDRSEISITLIDSPGMNSPGHWELEICDMTEANQLNGLLLDGDFSNCRLPSRGTNERIPAPAIKLPGNLASAVSAAERCQATIEAWHCPQGGIALILIVPKIKSQAVAA